MSTSSNQGKCAPGPSPEGGQGKFKSLALNSKAQSNFAKFSARSQQPFASQRINPKEILDIVNRVYDIVIISPSDFDGSQYTNQDESQGKLVIIEDEIPFLVRNLGQQGVQHAKDNQLKEAIYNFRKAEIIIDSYNRLQGHVSQELILFIVINMGTCFYKVNLYDEAFSCFESADVRIKEFEQLLIMQSMKKLKAPTAAAADNLLQLGNKMKYNKIRVNLNFQNCILFSELGKHQEALNYAKHASQLSFGNAMNSLLICYHIFLKFVQNATHSIKMSQEQIPSATATEKKTLTKTCSAKQTGADEAPGSHPSAKSEIELQNYCIKIIPILEELHKVVNDERVLQVCGNEKLLKAISQMQQTVQMYFPKNIQPNLAVLTQGLSDKHWMYQ